MNHAMWEHAATRANLATLRDRGVAVVAPGVGALATKHEWGVGRLAEPAELLAAVEAVVPAGARPWDGLHVLVTAGGTREPIDSVRFVGNRSSGRMGFALADEAAALGADVTVVAANVALPRNPRVRYVDVVTAAELQAARRGRLRHGRRAAHGGRRGRLPPARGRAGEAQEGRSRRPAPGPRADGRRARRRSARAGARARRSSASRPSTGPTRWTRRARSASASASTRSCSTTSPGRTSASTASDNEVTIVTEDGERRVPRAAKGEVARAILAAVTELRAGAAGEART